MYSKEIRNLVLKAIAEGKSVKEISKIYNISSVTIYNWKKNFLTNEEQDKEQIKLSTLHSIDTLKCTQTVTKRKKLILSHQSLSISKKENIKKEIDISKIKIKDIFVREILEIKKIIYTIMNAQGRKEQINMWDNFCMLIEKSIADKDALNRFVIVAEKANRLSNLVSVDMNNIETKIRKYIRNDKPSEN